MSRVLSTISPGGDSVQDAVVTAASEVALPANDSGTGPTAHDGSSMLRTDNHYICSTVDAYIKLGLTGAVTASAADSMLLAALTPIVLRTYGFNALSHLRVGSTDGLINITPISGE